MKKTTTFYIILMLFFFTMSIISIYLYKLNERTNAPKIVLDSEKNPLEVVLPEAKNSNMSIEEIEKSLKILNVEEDELLEVRDIE